MQRSSKPTYRVCWSRFTGRYEGVCSAHPATIVLGDDPIVVLDDLMALTRLLDR